MNQNFWSHGTPIGSLGPLSGEDPILGFDQHRIPVIWGPYEPPVVVALETFAENPKMAGSRCAHDIKTLVELGHSFSSKEPQMLVLLPKLLFGRFLL